MNREEHEQTEGESHVKSGVMRPQVRELAEARERPGTDPPWSLQGSMALQDADFRLRTF